MAKIDSEEIEALMLEIAYPEHEQFRDLLAEVFERVPQEDAEILVEERNIRFILAVSSQSIYFPVPLPADYYLLVLESTFCDWPHSEQIYTVAHEMAHAFLDHRPTGSSDPNFGDRRELETDEQVIKWGFENQVRQHGFMAVEEQVAKEHTKGGDLGGN